MNRCGAHCECHCMCSVCAITRECVAILERAEEKRREKERSDKKPKDEKA